VCTVACFTDGHGPRRSPCSGLTCAAESSVHPRISGLPAPVMCGGRSPEFAVGVLGPGHPDGDDAALLVSVVRQ
jgi:hypothetical protein